MKPPKTEHFSPKFILIAGVTSAKLPHPFFQTHVLKKKRDTISYKIKNLILPINYNSLSLLPDSDMRKYNLFKPAYMNRECVHALACCTCGNAY